MGENWSTNWPQWRDWRPFDTYLARTTEVVEQGSPRMDVAIYNDNGLSSPHDSSPIWANPKLGAGGYTYEFVDPVSLTMREAGAVKGRLFGNGPDYRALVVNNQSTIPADTAQAILRMAKAGLHVVVVGHLPSASPGLLRAPADDAAVRRAMKALVRLSDVAHVGTEAAAPTALARLGVSPAARFPSSGALMTVHRHARGREIWWIYNPTPSPISAIGSFAAVGQPSQLDLWNGTTSVLARYAGHGGRTDVPVTLAPYATTALVFSRPTHVHVVASSAQQVSYGTGRKLVLADARGGTRSATLSNGRRLTVHLGRVPAALNVRSWALSVEAISPTGTTSHALTLNRLRDWRTIPGLETAVGSAIYTAKVNVPPSWLRSHRQVLISVGDVEGAMRLAINGKRVTSQTTSDVRRSVTGLLHSGANQITVRLDTTLLDQMVALARSDNPAYATGPTPLTSAPSGLIGPVKLIPEAVATIGS
ncbi:MAG: glycosyl hydrolase [Solirubrobacteraceae bacterium]